MYEAFVPVTSTVTRVPTSAGCNTYVDAVAPEIAEPFLFHEYEYESGVGDHEPGTAVKV